MTLINETKLAALISFVLGIALAFIVCAAAVLNGTDPSLTVLGLAGALTTAASLLWTGQMPGPMFKPPAVQLALHPDDGLPIDPNARLMYVIGHYLPVFMNQIFGLTQVGPEPPPVDHKPAELTPEALAAAKADAPPPTPPASEPAAAA